MESILQFQPSTTDLEQRKRHWEEFIIASLLSCLDFDLHGFNDQILTNETLLTSTNAYSQLLH